MSDAGRIDRDALLCALVLAPTTFARNRFFALYTEPWARKARGRAAQLRNIVRHLAALTPKPELRELELLPEGGGVVRYGLPSLHFERTATLEPIELAVVRFALSRRPGVAAAPLVVTADDRRQVEEALAKLGQRLGTSGPIDLESSTFSSSPTSGDS